MPFQTRFLRRALAPGVDTAALSLPRGNGKSTLVAHLAQRFLTPGDPLHVAGAESHIIAASIGQARRTVFKQLRGMIGDDSEYRVAESVNNCHVDHKATKTRLSILAAKGKTAQGLVDVPFVFADEPGAWEVVGGQLVWDALETALGKPDSAMRIMLIGTLAPLGIPGHWWHSLISDGPGGNRHVAALYGNPDKWDSWPELRRCNPLMSRFPKSRAVLMRERDKARADTRLKARFLSYRLNVPTADESATLLTVEDWQQATARKVPPREGPFLAGIDLGAGRAWSAAVALWQSGRMEALAVAPGIPDIAAQERRDRVPAGTYARLVANGTLTVAEGLRVPPPRLLIERIGDTWGSPASIICDRFRVSELKDCCKHPVTERVTRWSEAAADVRALRKMAKDGPLSCPPECRDLVTASLAVATVKNDDQGNCRIEKRGTNNTARDDVAQALALAAGAWDRASKYRPGGGMYHGVV